MEREASRTVPLTVCSPPSCQGHREHRLTPATAFSNVGGDNPSPPAPTLPGPLPHIPAQS